MANKFQKSVLERLEQESSRVNKEEKGHSEGINNSDEAVLDVHTAVDIEKYLRREPERRAKNKTFYLDGDVIDAIRSTAKAQGVTDSKLVNDILRQVLGVR